MKLLLLLAAVLLGVWLWRSGRGNAAPRERERPPPPPPEPQDMVACALCGLHVPRGDAVSGRHGLYCCAEHQQRAEP